MIFVNGKPLRLHYLETKRIVDLTPPEAKEAKLLFHTYLTVWKKLEPRN